MESENLLNPSNKLKTESSSSTAKFNDVSFNIEHDDKNENEIRII